MAEDKETIKEALRDILTDKSPQAPDIESLREELRVSIPTEVPLSADKEILQEKSSFTIPVELAEARNAELKSVFIPFDGQWMPDNEPIEIGAQNYKTLQNYRYAGDTIIHLESVLGYTKINTTSLSTYSYENIRNGIQLRSEFTKKTYVLVHTEHDTHASNYSRVYQNQTAIPSQGNFESTALHTDSAYSLEGRFSDAPDSQVAYCNGKESCIWAGEEMRCAGFFTLFAPKIVGSSDISFVDGGGSADTITDGGSGFRDAGFRDGHTFTVSGSTDNDGEYLAVTVADATITLITGVLTAEANTSATIIASVKRDHLKARDFSEAVNNEVNSAAECATLDAGTTGNRWMVLSTRPLKAIKYYVRTANTSVSTTTCRVWDGDSFKLVTNASDATKPATISMAATGIFSFDSTAYKSVSITSSGLAFVNSNPDTITDTGTGFVTAGFLAGMTIKVSGSSSNDDVYTIDTVTAGTLTLVTGDAVTVEGASATITITSIRTAKPLHFEGLCLYAYLFELSAGSAELYYVTVDAPFQDIVDVWDGVYRQPISCQVGRGLTVGGAISGSANLGAFPNPSYPGRILVPAADWPDIQIGAEITANSLTHTVVAKSQWALGWAILVDAYVHHTLYNGGVGYSYTYANPIDSGDAADYKDFTLEVIEPSFADYPIGAVIDGLTSANCLVVGFEERMSAIWFEMIADLVNTNSVKMTVSYWNGETYVTQVGQSDSSYGLPGTSGVNKSFNRSGLVSWDAPEEEDEFRQTLFGVTGYFYQISVDGTLSGTEGGVAEVVIDTIKGIPAQHVVNPFKFSVQYKNRLMLCGFTEGNEGNRIDYSVKDAADVFNGEESSMNGIQSLYIGGREDLTGAIELFNRFGSNIISSLLLFKNTETYLLTGDGPENYRIYTISKTIGCPAPLTLAAAETGYTFAEEINRNIVAWASYSGPMIFDAAAILPIPGIRKYFDPAKTARLETSIVERCRGWVDNTYREYNLVIPSATGATACNVWLVYDLVRKRWFEKYPGASEVPQAAWPAYDTDGKQYIYAGIDDGNVMRLENGATWADDSATAMSPVIETGDFFPSGGMWDITSLRRVKTAVKKITEASKNLAITWYKDTESSGTSLTAHDLDAGDPISKSTQGAPSATPLRGWCHRLNFALSAGFAAETQFRPIGWGYQFVIDHDDERDV